MVLRKPYAFLIKHFQKINLILLALVSFIFYRATKLHQFTNNYTNTGIYNDNYNNIGNYVDLTVILAFLLTIALSATLLYLLKRKDKPIISYVLIMTVNILVFVFFLYNKHYFEDIATKKFDLVGSRLLNDFALISILPYYVLMFILAIRTIGLDLKNFGFQEDKEFLEINESDREEVEVQVGFDKHKWIRKIKYYFRNTKYFVLEHKYQLAVIFAVLALIGAKQLYDYVFIENRIYKMNQVVNSNRYGIKVKNTYLTDKGYNGQVVAYDGEYFVIVEVEITNKEGYDRIFDNEKMLLYINHDYYVTTTKYNDYFKDMGNLYKEVAIKGRETKTYLLVYKVPKPDKNADFLLKYQDMLSKDGKLIQIKIKLVDISEFKTKDKAKYPAGFTIPINLEEKVTFNIKKYSLEKAVQYSYKVCNSNGSCPIKVDEYNAKQNERVLYMTFNYDGDSKDDFINFVKNYGRIRYKVNNEVKEVKVKYAFNKNYKGKYLYIVVPEEIKNATSIDLLFTVRSYQYIYTLKGE